MRSAVGLPAGGPALVMAGVLLAAGGGDVGAFACGPEVAERSESKRVTRGSEAPAATRSGGSVDSLGAEWIAGPPLPRPVANNAVAALGSDRGLRLFSFLGIGPAKDHEAIGRAAHELDPRTGAWRELPAVPGEEGRIAPTAEAVGDRIYVFGGYTVDAEGGEVSVAGVDVWDPEAEAWSEAAPFPVPVDDAVSGVWRDSLVYLVSGWSQSDNVADVQIYDPAGDSWSRATPIPGPPVFGHAGAIVENAIVYCGGARVDPARAVRFVISDSCWRGEIDPAEPSRIAWSRLAPHPGPPKYRAAAGAVPGAGLVVFAGGTSNPYNFDGVGYDGTPSEPDGATFAYDVRADRWIPGPAMPVPTMDHRKMVGDEDGLWILGGMEAGQEVTRRTARLVLGIRDGSEGRR